MPPCGLLCPTSCTDGAIHAFPNKTWKLLSPGVFVLSFNGTPHPLGYCSWSYSSCFSECFSCCAIRQLCCQYFHVHIYMHVCSRMSGSVSVRLHRLESTCSAKHQQLPQCGILWKCMFMHCAQGVCYLEFPGLKIRAACMYFWYISFSTSFFLSSQELVKKWLVV